MEDNRLYLHPAHCGMKSFMQFLHGWRMTELVLKSVASLS